MSQAHNQLNWCIKKAEREIKECRDLGKREKHRGIIKIDPDIERSKKHILKAEHNLRAIKKFNEIGYSDWSMSATFYSLYHCFLAIASKFGYESKNQICTINLIKYLVEKGEINLGKKYIELLEYEEIEQESVIDRRESLTYGINTSIDEKEVDKMFKTGQELLDITKDIIFK